MLGTIWHKIFHETIKGNKQNYFNQFSDAQERAQNGDKVVVYGLDLHVSKPLSSKYAFKYLNCVLEPDRQNMDHTKILNFFTQARIWSYLEPMPIKRTLI